MSCISAALGASESHTWKIASPGGVSGVPLSLSSYPVAGRGRSLPETLFRVKRIFEIFCAAFLQRSSNPCVFMRVRVKKIIFGVNFLALRQKSSENDGDVSCLSLRRR